ncbi:MAG TPA: hypothetical protein VMX35_03875 [Acidobacteriota bacterium]|nr:hypothetical protein [Acidobacteriota bacterium]
MDTGLKTGGNLGLQDYQFRSPTFDAGNHACAKHVILIFIQRLIPAKVETHFNFLAETRFVILNSRLDLVGFSGSHPLARYDLADTQVSGTQKIFHTIDEQFAIVRTGQEVAPSPVRLPESII